MTEQKLESEDWHIRLPRHHYHFFKQLASEIGDVEQGASARACRRFLNDKIREYKKKVGE